MGQYDSWEYLTNFIKKHPGTFEAELAKPPYAVKVKRHTGRPNLVMFKYHQFESDFTNPIVRCCRGSVYDIREDGTVKPCLMPFFKFCNYGETGADPIDWNHTLYVRDKLDGSLLKLLREEEGDLWTTNGSFEVDTEVPEMFPAETEERFVQPYTFAGLRDYALRGHEEEIKNLPASWTFMFELTSPYNRIIVPYKTTSLTLLGCRDPEGHEHTPEWAAEQFHLTFATPEVYSFKTIDEVVAYCESAEADGREGVVIQDDHFNRVKIKGSRYRSLFFLKGEDHFNDAKLFFSIKQGSIDDALAGWPEIRPRTEEIIAEWNAFRHSIAVLCASFRNRYAALRRETPEPKEAKKRYAMMVLETCKPFSGFLFEAIKENADLEPLFNRIEYRELKSYWIPALEGSCVFEAPHEGR